MRPNGFPLARQERPPLSHGVIDHLVEHEPMNVHVRLPVMGITEEETSVQHPDHYLGLLPELLFPIVGTTLMGPLDKYAAELEIDPVGNRVLEDAPQFVH